MPGDVITREYQDSPAQGKEVPEACYICSSRRVPRLCTVHKCSSCRSRIDACPLHATCTLPDPYYRRSRRALQISMGEFWFEELHGSCPKRTDMHAFHLRGTLQAVPARVQSKARALTGSVNRLYASAGRTDSKDVGRESVTAQLLLWIADDSRVHVIVPEACRLGER